MIQRSLLAVYEALVPRGDHEWLAAVLAESPAVADRDRVWWLLGAIPVLAYALLRRLFQEPVLWVLGLAAGVLVAYMGIEMSSLTPHLVLLAAVVAVLAFVARDWPWRWALLVSLPKPLLVGLGWQGRYLYDPFDAYYAVLPSLVIAFTAAWLSSRLWRRTAT